MSHPKIAQKSPFAFDVEAGKKYAWCSCGHSQNQPLCDGSHVGTGFLPNIVKAAESERVYFCGCKKTSDSPFCDGTHNEL